MTRPTRNEAGSLVDWQINYFGATGGIEPYRRAQLNPASYNLRVGCRALIEARPNLAVRAFRRLSGVHLKPQPLQPVDLSDHSQQRPFWVAPGQLVLVNVDEWINIPVNHEAQVLLRSSAGRLGWDHALSGYVDPGYSGRLTLELVNCRRWQSLPLYPGLMLVQLRLYRLEEVPARPYHLTGRYCNANAVQPSLDQSLE